MLIRMIAMDAAALVASILVPLGILLRTTRGSTRFALRLPGPAAGDAEAWIVVAALQLRRGRIAGGVIAGVVVLLIGATWLPLNLTDWYLWSLLVPVIVTSIGLAALFLSPLATPPRFAGASRPLDLSPRTIWSFGQRWWFAGWAVVTALLAGTIIAAGVISDPDEKGRYTLLTISVGTVSASSQFLGWFYGFPLLLGVALLTVLTVLSLRATTRPPLAAAPDSRALDVLLRRLRTRTVLALSTGALLVTLGLAWKLIGLAARLRGGALTETVGQVEVGTTFAALATPIWAAGYLAEGFGLALLLLPLLARAPRLAAADTTAAPPRGAVPSGASA